jgi:hypothetical protein
MTGQAKEEVIKRLGELGVLVEEGCACFRPMLLRLKEFLTESGTYSYFDLEGEARSIDVPARALAFSLCQVPIVYELSDDEAWIRITMSDGTSSEISGDRLDASLSKKLFARSGSISRIDVGVLESSLIEL